MGAGVPFKVAGAIYFGFAFWIALAIAAWPFLPERPFVLSRAVIALIVAAICAGLGAWSIRVTRRSGPTPKAYVIACVAPMIIVGPLSGVLVIVLFAIPVVFVAWGSHTRGEGAKQD